jgi:hypothetical protein
VDVCVCEFVCGGVFYVHVVLCGAVVGCACVCVCVIVCVCLLFLVCVYVWVCVRMIFTISVRREKE